MVAEPGGQPLPEAQCEMALHHLHDRVLRRSIEFQDARVLGAPRTPAAPQGRCNMAVIARSMMAREYAADSVTSCHDSKHLDRFRLIIRVITPRMASRACVAASVMACHVSKHLDSSRLMSRVMTPRMASRSRTCA